MPEEEHPVLRLAGEAGKNIEAIGEFFNPVEKYFGPHEPEDWPRDLTRSELTGLIPQLNLAVANLSWTFTNILQEELDNVTDPEQARLITVGIGLLDQAYTALKAGETLFRPPQTRPAVRRPQETAARSFPHGTPADPALGEAGQQPGASPGPAANPARQRRPRGRGV
jgi:hypothetical protein